MDFDEFLDFRTDNEELSSELRMTRENNSYLSLRRKELNKLFGEYLTYGGYPAVAMAPSEDLKKLKLKDLLQSFVKRDIQESNISDPDKFYRLMLLLSHQTGSLVNVNELSATLKSSVTAIENYLFILQKCYHIYLLRPFYQNSRKELTKMPKIYFHDLGLRNMLLYLFNPVYQRMDKGELIENYAFIRLREHATTNSLFFWRTTDGHEIDFIVKESPDTGKAIEVKFDQSTFNIMKYKKFTETYPGFPLQPSCWEASSNFNKIIAL